jgi:hypothetical protein
MHVPTVETVGYVVPSLRDLIAASPDDRVADPLGFEGREIAFLLVCARSCVL